MSYILNSSLIQVNGTQILMLLLRLTHRLCLRLRKLKNLWMRQLKRRSELRMKRQRPRREKSSTVSLIVCLASRRISSLRPSVNTSKQLCLVKLALLLKFLTDKKRSTGSTSLIRVKCRCSSLSLSPTKLTQLLLVLCFWSSKILKEKSKLLPVSSITTRTSQS